MAVPGDGSIWWLSRWQPCWQFWAVPLQAPLADISPDMHFTFEHKRSAVEKMEKSFFPTFVSFCSPSKEACEWGMKKQARRGSNFYPSLSENRYTRVPRQSKRFHTCCPSKCILSHPTVPKGVLTICTRWEAEGEGKEEANWQRERKREAESDWMHSPPCFTSPWHLEASPKLLVKTQAGVWWIKQQRQPLPSLPSRLCLWYFSHYQSVCCVCFIHCRVNEYFWSSLHPPAHSCSHHPSSSFTFKPRPQLIYHHQLSLSFVSQFVQLSSPKTDVNCLLCSLLRCQFKVDETFAIIITANPVCRRHCWFSLLLLSVFEEVASSHFSTSFLRHVN